MPHTAVLFSLINFPTIWGDIFFSPLDHKVTTWYWPAEKFAIKTEDVQEYYYYYYY